MIKEWLEECLGSGAGKLYTTKDYNFVIYKGFKITENPETGNYEILDVRYNDFYTRVSSSDLAVFEKYGFVKGADLIMRDRDVMRMLRDRTILEHLYQEKENLLQSKDSYSPRKFRLRFKNIIASIQERTDGMFFYQTRKNQVENKYELTSND